MTRRASFVGDMHGSYDPITSLHHLSVRLNDAIFIRLEDGGPLRPCASLNSHRCVRASTGLSKLNFPNSEDRVGRCMDDNDIEFVRQTILTMRSRFIGKKFSTISRR
ncbi:hypothetical protein AVEN_116426-1 [Araneus ventricosus]|uniref:Uncharacterized protein n=1 Tax=Araneus ventricosus TaxID=182803 RepID=A0A4Y2KIJ4_ARAVE|nr:hypothetical protein AVEN_116426-1 [Araneus ventricosus]